MLCPDCQFENSSSSRFCSQCGARLAAAPEPRMAGEAGERRQITAFFCDLVGSTELARGLDPEDFADAVRAYHTLCREAIEEHGGHVAQYLGDGVFAYFGYPQAGENDPEMAVRAGLEILARLERRNCDQPPQGTALRVRVGVHTGPVVVQTVGGDAGERLALGETPNFAAHLQAAAEPGTLLVSESTYGLVRGFFVIDVRSDVRVKSSPEPITAYRVIRASGVRSRFEAAANAGRTQFVGRTAELKHLCESWAQVRDGAGKCVVISGEPGIGKSRLIEAFREDLAQRDQAVNWVACTCAARLRGSSLAPMIELVRRAVGMEGVDAALDAERINLALQTAGLDAAASVPLMCALLGVPLPSGFARPEMSPQLQRRRTRELLVQWLVRASSIRPIVAVIDDVQWADPSTQELLGELVDQLPGSRVLALFAQRPGPVAWGGTHVSTLPLRRLSDDETRALVNAVVHDRASQRTEELVVALASRADGVPLFAEELTKMMMEQETPGADRIPATLQDSLMSRLDRLGPFKELAQLGAVIGREFPVPLLRSLAGLEELRLRRGVEELARSGLVHLRGAVSAPDALCVFKHVLVQDAAYQSLLRSRRRVLHKLVGAALDAQRREGVDVDPVVLAQHYTRAEEHEEAIAAWLEAVRRATTACAVAEATHHLTRARELVGEVGELRRRDELALDLDLAEMNLHTTVYGPAADRIGAVLDRSHALAASLQATDRMFMVTLFGCAFCSSRGDVAESLRLGMEALAIADEMGMPALQVAALQLASTSWLQLAQYGEAVRRCEQALALHEPPGLLGESFNTKTILLMNLGTARWCLGQRGRAIGCLQDGIRNTWTGNGIPPMNAGWALTFLAWLYLLEGDLTAARRTLAHALSCAEKTGFDILGAFGRGLSLCVELSERADPEAMAQLDSELNAHPQVGPVVSYQRAILALATARCDEVPRADELFEEILSRAAARNEKHGVEELLRMRAEALRLGGAKLLPRAEDCLRESISLARSRDALGFELRSAVTLAELLRDTGREGEARRQLTDVLARCPEDCDGPERVRSERLLAALASA